MKVILNIVLLVLAAGAVFFSLMHSKKISEISEARVEFTRQNTEVSANARATETDLKAAQAELKKFQDERELAVQSVSAQKASEAALKREIAELDQTLLVQKEEFSALEKTLNEVTGILSGLGGDVTMDNLGDKIVEIDKDVKSRQAKLDDLNTLIEGAQKQIETSKAESKRLSERVVERNVRISRNAFEAVVTAVNQEWGFVVIGAGSNSGFAPQSSLLVKRDGRLIGRVTPTSVEKTQTIADIDPDSVATGVRFQPGDRVILANPASN
jgi:hypothetical protein